MTEQLHKIAVLVSGGGTNLQAIIDASESGKIRAQVERVISSNPKAYALERAAKHGIRALSLTNFEDIARELEGSDLIVLAGYMKILPQDFVKKFKGKIINIHPSLIPKHCGKGFYGIKVHESVIKSKDKESGATVHFVDEGVDSGHIIIQKKVTVEDTETAESLAAKVLKVEHEILIEAINIVLSNIDVEKGR